MKTTLYYLFLLMIFFLVSCENSSNVSDPNTKGMLNGLPIIERTINEHDYININSEYVHSGTCRKCKHERDSIVNLIIENIKNK